LAEGLTARLARFAAGLTYEQLPPAAIVTVKRIVIDCLGAALAGSTLGSGAKELLAIVEAAGGRPEAAILGTQLRAPAVMASLANGGLAHALNYDDFLSAAEVHLGVTSLPAALAAAECAGDVSGKELITALAAGNELMARLGFAVQGASTGYTVCRPRLASAGGGNAQCAGDGLHASFGRASAGRRGDARQSPVRGLPQPRWHAERVAGTPGPRLRVCRLRGRSWTVRDLLR